MQCNNKILYIFHLLQLNVDNLRLKHLIYTKNLKLYRWCFYKRLK